MKLVTWNCNKRWPAISGQIAQETPDLAVVQECANIPSVSFPSVEPYQCLAWLDCYNPATNKVHSPHNGMGVFSWTGWTGRRYGRYDSSIRCALPLYVDGPLPLNILAVWNKTMEPAPKDRISSYVYMLERLLDGYDTFISQPNMGANTIILGDFNTSASYEDDERKNRLTHKRMMERFAARGLVSAYHAFHGIEHGDPGEELTHNNHSNVKKRVLHLDYCLIPDLWVREKRLRSVTLGEYGASDHRSVIVDIDLDTPS